MREIFVGIAINRDGDANVFRIWISTKLIESEFCSGLILKHESFFKDSEFLLTNFSFH